MIKQADVVYQSEDCFIELWDSLPSPQNSGGPCVTISINNCTYGSIEEALDKAPQDIKEFII